MLHTKIRTNVIALAALAAFSACSAEDGKLTCLPGSMAYVHLGSTPDGYFVTYPCLTADGYGITWNRVGYVLGYIPDLDFIFSLKNSTDPLAEANRKLAGKGCNISEANQRLCAAAIELEGKVPQPTPQYAPNHDWGAVGIYKLESGKPNLGSVWKVKGGPLDCDCNSYRGTKNASGQTLCQTYKEADGTGVSFCIPRPLGLFKKS